MLAARLLSSALAALSIAIWSAEAGAQIADRCLAVSQAPRLVQPVALKKSEVRLTFVGHSTWLIEIPLTLKSLHRAPAGEEESS